MSSGSDHNGSLPATNREPEATVCGDARIHATAPGRTTAGPEDTPKRATSVIALAARPPVVLTDAGWRAAPGGLAPIVARALRDRGGAWVSWNGVSGTSPPQRVDGLGFDIFTFNLSRKDADGFYGGFANRTLWPLLHDVVGQPVFDRSWWHGYRSASEAFALAARVAASRLGGSPTLWVHDYHLFLLPERLRHLGLDNPLSFFLHTPFPSPAIFARLPQRTEILRGLADADVVGFHTEGDRGRFLESWSQWGPTPAPRTMVAPASIDTHAFAAAASDPAVVRRARRLREKFQDSVLLFGVERLDYTKGIPERLRALEILFERRADLRRRVVYVQVANPSRERVPEYQRLRVRVESEVGRLNGRFTSPGQDVPFRYIHRAVSQEQLLAYYIAADVAIVTPLRDGMNLVAKEFVTTQAAAKGSGALVLSEFAGAAAELTDAVQCNPFDPTGTADAIEQAIEMGEDERRKRLAEMAVQVENNDIVHWADQLLRSAERTTSSG